MHFGDLFILGRALSGVAYSATGAAEQGLSASEFAVLLDIFDNEPTPINAIAARTGVAQSRVSTAVQHLAYGGYVLTGSDPADRRKTIVEVTSRSRAEGARIRQLDISQALAPVFADCDADELEWVMSALERLTQLVQPVSHVSSGTSS